MADVTAVINELKAAAVAHERAFQAWDATKPGSTEADFCEAGLRGAQQRLDAAERAVIELIPEPCSECQQEGHRSEDCPVGATAFDRGYGAQANGPAL